MINDFLEVGMFEELPEENVPDNSGESEDKGKGKSTDANSDTRDISISELPEDYEVTPLEDLNPDEENDDSDIEDKDDSNEPNVFKAFGVDLQKSGLIDEDFDLDSLKDPDTLTEAVGSLFQKQLEIHKAELAKSMATEYKKFLEDNNIKDDSTLSKYSDLDPSELEDNEELNKEIIKHYYSTVSGLEPKVIKTIIDNELDLETLSKELHSKLIEKDQSEKARLAEEFKARKEAEKAKLAELDQVVFKNAKGLNEFVPGVKVDDNYAKTIKSKIPDTLNKINQDLHRYGPLLTLFDDIGFFDGKFDSLINKGITKGTSELQKLLDNKNVSGNKKNADYGNGSKIPKDPNVNSWYR